MAKLNKPSRGRAVLLSIKNSVVDRAGTLLLEERKRKKEQALRATEECLSPGEANRYIGDLLQGGRPFMVGRFGSVELGVVRRFRKMQLLSSIEKATNYCLTGDWTYWWSGRIMDKLENNAGFFPVNAKNIERFVELMIRSMGEVDLLGSWVQGEGYFRSELRNASICKLRDIEPYYHEEPWSQYLEGRKVLVIHPFATSIRRQYERCRSSLFKHPRVLPDFDLTVLPAVQSIAGNHPQKYKDWFSALEDMYQQAMASEADVTILGCGAYGFPLAAMLKAAGRSAIHMGGSTQILFGIKGRRWDGDPIVSSFYNEYWTRPSVDERPKGVERVEGACYW